MKLDIDDATATQIDPHAVTLTDTTLSHLLSGKAIFTLQSKATGARFTYEVTKKVKPDGDLWFVGLLNGPDNHSYAYLAFMRDIKEGLRTSAKSCAKADAPSFKAIQWTLSMLEQGKVGKFAEQVEVWHEGRCFRCGRRLTVPSSIETGLGPVCAGLV